MVVLNYYGNHTSFKAFILALKCGVLSILKVMSSRTWSIFCADSWLHTRRQTVLSVFNKTDTLPTSCREFRRTLREVRKECQHGDTAW